MDINNVVDVWLGGGDDVHEPPLCYGGIRGAQHRGLNGGGDGQVFVETLETR